MTRILSTSRHISARHAANSAIRLLAASALAAALTHPVRADDGDEAALLLSHGAPELAERLIERYQAEPGTDAAARSGWEKQRIALDFAREYWAAVLTRVAALPAATPPELRQWAETRAAEAELALQRPAAARDRLARLIWAKEESLSVKRLAEWRRLVVETYMAERRAGDAETALQRYLLDTPRPDADDQRLTARVWLSKGRAQDVVALLADSSDPESRVWALVADLRSQRRSADTVLAQAQALANAVGTAPDTRRRLWAVAAEAAQTAGDDASRVTALEQALDSSPGQVSDGDLLRADADALWEAYLHYGMQLAQRAQLAAGDYLPWLEIEARLHDKKPLEARALMAVLALQDPLQPHAATAHQRLAASLEAAGRGGELEALYLHSTRFADVEAVPVAVRYSLAAVALERGDLPAAARLIGKLQPPPTPMPVTSWELARARVLLAAGSVELGLGVLEDVVKRAPELDLAARRGAMRAVGALQTLRRHQVAIGLLQRLAAASPEMELQRELQFWLGLSYEALGDYQRAALSYLRTAYLAGEQGAADGWGQRGRYHAAAALAHDGLTGDARRLYMGLLGADTAAGQRAQALRALDQLGAR